MFEIRCYDENFKEIKHLAQWDVNRFIIVKNIEVDTVPEFHFCNKKSESAIPVVSKLIKDDNDRDCYIAEIPDILLQQPLDIIVYIYVDSVVQDKISSKTAHMARIPLMPRPKPEDYPYEVVENHIDYLGQLITKATELEESLKNGMGSLGVNPDHNQNDPTQPDYIKNRLAYRCRKFEDMESTKYPEPIFCVIRAEIDGELYEEPIGLKFSDLPENVTPYEIIEELIGAGFMGEEMRFDDPEMFDPEMLQSMKREKIFDENGNVVGAYFEVGQPMTLIIEKDNFDWNYVMRYEDDGEVYEEIYPIHFPEKGIYTVIISSEEDDNGEIIQRYTFDKILFREVKPIDKELLPLEALSKAIEVDDRIQKDSDNPVTSDAVYWMRENLNQAINNKMDKITFSSSDEGRILGVSNCRIVTIHVGTAEGGYY